MREIDHDVAAALRTVAAGLLQLAEALDRKEGDDMRKISLAAMMLIAANVQGTAAEGRAVMGMGMQSCGAWTKARQPSNAYERTRFRSWLAGYVSAMNLDPNTPDVLLDTDFEALSAWVDNYCQSNPLRQVATAADRLMDELRSRR